MAVEPRGSVSAITRQAPAEVTPRWFAGSFLLLLGQSIAVFLVVVGARFWLIGRYGSDLPYWDQWDAEGAGLFKKAFEGTLSFNDWVAPHNEHRVLFTRVVSYVLKSLNGQWDARVQMVFNASFYAAVPSMLFVLFARKRPCLFGPFWSIVLAAVFSCPFGWENTLAGFQSQFYFLSAFSLATMWLMVTSPPQSCAWTAGVAIGFGSLFTMGSGMLAPAAVLALVLLEITVNPDHWRQLFRERLPTVVGCLAILAVGAALVTTVEAHAQYKAQDAGQFIISLLSGMAWPWLNVPVITLLVWGPAIIYLGSCLYRRMNLHDEERFLVAALFWILLQIAATAYSRSTIVGSSRYSDTFSLGVLLNTVCAGSLLANHCRSHLIKGGMVIVVVVYFVVNSFGMYLLGFNGADAARKQTYEMQKFRVGEYLATGNSRLLTDVQRKTDIPYPGPKRLAELLADPAIAPVLPVSVRKPLVIGDSVGAKKDRVTKYQLGQLSPYPWEVIHSLANQGGAVKSMMFPVRKLVGLPFLRFFIQGDVNNVSIIDSHNSEHTPIIIARDRTTGWQEVAVTCPGHDCRIKLSGTSRFSDPKEMGLLSVGAVLAAGTGSTLFFAGIGCFVALLLGCGVVVLRKTAVKKLSEYR